MAIRNDDSRAELAARLDQLYGIVDELPLPGLNEEERVDILQSVASEMEEEYSPFARLGRAETAGNAGTGLGAYDPARIGGGYSFEPIVMGREEYMRVGAALAEAVRDVDADVFDMEDELADRAAFAMVGRGYLKSGADREEAFMADPGLHASFADAWEKAKYLQAGFPLLGGLRSVYNASDGEGDPEKSVPETKPRAEPRERPAERKGFVARHRKAIGIGIAGLFAAAAGFGIYTVMNNTPRNQFTRAAQAKGVSAGEAGDIYDSIYDSAMNDRQITIDRQHVAADIAQRVLDSGVVAQHPKNWTLWGIGNMTVAEDQLGLPKVPDAKLVEAAQVDPEYKGSIVDFTVLHVKNNDGVMADVGSASPARDTWMLAKLLTERPDLAPQAEKHAWLNQLVRQNAYNMFDGPYGLKGVDYKEMHTPTEAKVWEVLLGFNDYMDRLPAKLAANNIEMVYPYNDLSKLKGKIADYTNRTIALMYLADIPRSSWMLGANSEVKGLDGMQNYVHRLEGKLDAFLAWHNDPIKQRRALDVGFGSLVADRYARGLRNTVYQALDMQAPDANDKEGLLAASKKILHCGTDENATGVVKVIPKIVREVLGYDRLESDDKSSSGEDSSYRFDLPLLFKALGIPASGFTASPNPHGTSSVEYAGPITDAEVRFLKQKYGPKIAIGYGNMLNPFYSNVGGAELDDITKISQSNGYCPTCDNLDGPLLWKK